MWGYNLNIWRTPAAYKEIICSPDCDAVEDAVCTNSDTTTIGRFVVMVGAQSPTLCALKEQVVMADTNTIESPNGEDDSDNNALVDACILGRILAKLEQFCRHERTRGTSQYAMYCIVNISLYLAYGVLMAPVLMAILSVECHQIDDTYSNTTTGNQDGDVVQWGDRTVVCPPVGKERFIAMAFVILVSYILFFLVFIWVGRSMRDWKELETRLDAVVEEVWQDLRGGGLSTGYSLSRRTNVQGIFSFGHLAGTVEIDVHKASDASLPPAPQDQSLVSNSLQEIDVAMMLANAAQESTLRIDAWVRGGLMLQLRTEQYNSTAKSRRTQWCMLAVDLAVTIGLTVWYAGWTNLSLPYYLLYIALLFLASTKICLIQMYLLEMMDAAAIHNASQGCVQKFSHKISEERHGIAMHYSVENLHMLLPGLTKGVLHFDTVGEIDSTCNQAKKTQLAVRKGMSAIV